jgi:hypothetical protein
MTTNHLLDALRNSSDPVAHAAAQVIHDTTVALIKELARSVMLEARLDEALLETAAAKEWAAKNAYHAFHGRLVDVERALGARC